MSDTQPVELNALTFPLHGSRLIEASAGTGKTFTIALLYVRLVLGARHPEDEAAFPRALTPPEILVVTFTNAATQELRERIRARLVEAAEVFRDEAPGEGAPGAGRRGGPMPGMASVAPREGFTAPPRRPAPGSAPSTELDPLLLALRDQYDPAAWPACARRLQLAAEWMDEAAVSTIHSWCYRMLREHAFDSGSLFSLELTTDQSELEQEVVRDYWRSFYYPLDAEALAEITRYWESPTEGRASLYSAVRPLIPESDALDHRAPPPAETLAAARAEREARLAELKAPWAAWLDELVPALEEAAQRKAFKGQSFNAKSRASWLGALRDWCEGEATRPALTAAAWKRLTPAGMAEIWKEGTPPVPAAWEALAELPEALDALPEPHADLLIHAVQWCRARLAREQERRAEMGPNDLLTHLDRALKGPSAETLAERIRQQFPVALVDEFQDTDPVQYRIFDRVYRLADNSPETGVFLIGDPKQAIYAFRGADIYTYLQARRDTAGRHVTLGTNYRSGAAMVAAVNRCFEFAEAHPPGAFLFKEGDGRNPVPFTAVKAKGSKDALVVDGHPQPAMTLWQLDSDEPLGKGAYLGEMAERCASHMVALLERGRRGAAGFDDGEAVTPLAPSDMAVLVNGINEAREIRRALARRGVKSVYLSDKDKVFASPMAAELETWLRACADPEDERLLRAALATPSLGLDLAALDRLQQDELAWEARVLQFRDYHRLWQRQGVLPLLRRLMNDFEVPGRLLAKQPANESSNGMKHKAPGAQEVRHNEGLGELTSTEQRSDSSVQTFVEGERWLTDLLHLGELLQHASQELDGEHALIRFLAEAIAAPDDQGEAHRLRLESDADLVQVITIHKSKGLEYPLVFLPFIGNHRATKADDSPLRWHDAEGRLRLSLAADETTLAIADRERLGEDLRKLYVALTRARHATWLGVAPLKGLEASALGQLLGNGEALTPENLGAALAALKGNEPAIVIEPAPPATAELFTPAQGEGELGEARRPTRPAREHWWIASYSALRTSGAILEPMPAPAQSGAPVSTDLPPKAGEAAILPEPTTPLEATAFEVMDEPRDSAATLPPQAHRLHRFPRGPGPGTFLHGLLEWAGEQGFGRAARDAALREEMLARRTQLRGWGAWLAPLNGWLGELLTTPLPLPEAPPVRLEELASYQVEMEFWFAAHRVATPALDRHVSAYTLAGAPRPALDADTLNGMLKGFIDLVFERDGRYYVLDWKSNHLGPDDDAYTQAAMRDAMADKRYDLQAALYLLALHRLLESRLPDYDYDRHIGGSLTVFLRGIGPATATEGRGVYAERPPRALIDTLDALFRGESAPTHAMAAEVRP
ncbi:UvrD-helicase domain-containing protein [Halomonas campisalis]|uniref:RecBCD enzyme subunit RecB n=1 Tax=Billgrantia campisalis TaxID=74661 RepID=A0ABS9PBA8_9GAMM|nr:UvrD-helicase domain-containing protein [Halomonas campisalis]MCG6659063.1 UvrD-helicase domain-containing protein [Halomonas campisalis]MDR5863903.1 UvrD-helicase domain-containing protein [Halomonas campisalis]